MVIFHHTGLFPDFPMANLCQRGPLAARLTIDYKDENS